MDSIGPARPEPHVEKSMRAMARAAAVAPIVTGALVLTGWSVGNESLKRAVPALVAMNPATAVGFLCLGLSLALRLRRSNRGAAVFAALAVLLGVVKLMAFTGFDLHIDEILFRDKLGGSDFGRPNRIAPNTALNFLLVGTALLILDLRTRRWWPAQYLAVVGAMSSVLALMGYAYGVQSFYGIGTFIPMALHTAAAFLIVSIGVLSARPERGIMAVVSSNSSGGQMVRRLLPTVLILPALLGWFRIAGTRAQFFDADSGLWLVMVLMMSVFAGLIGWNGRLLFRSDMDRAESEENLAYQATHDALTQLPNRRFFAEELERKLTLAGQSKRMTAVLFIDLDLFKVINDSLGHLVGDALLIAAGQRIASCIGPHDIVARISGDEFTVLLPEMETRLPAMMAAGRLLSAFGEPFTVGPHEVFTTVSIGIAFNEDHEAPVDLVRHADIAMYKAKSNGKARFEIFDPSMDEAAVRRLTLETELRRAIERKELCLYYQPEIELETGVLVGMEALIRWEHPERGLIQPNEFLQVAEETGLILPIGRWVMYEACRRAKEWQARYRPEHALMVAVNLSGKHFQQATLVDEVADVLERTGIEPSHLILEITETVAMAGAETTIEILSRLKSLGVQLAIDDFGTGFSSLSYLKRFPVDILKIDKSFVDGIALKGPDNAIVRAIIALGHALGLKVIAEGVETPEQVAQLRALGSELGQGFFYSEPLSDDTDRGIPRMLQAS